MAPRPPQVVLRRPHGAADEVADLIAGLPVDLAMADHQDDRRQPGPQPRVADPPRAGDYTARAGLTATAPDLLRLALGEIHPGLAVLQHLVERPTDILVEMRLVLLDRQQVLALPVDDGGGDLLLTSHGVDGHYSPLEVQELEQLGDGRDLVGLGVGGHLARVRRFSTAQALTTCKAERLTVRRAEPRCTLPSMAIGFSSAGSVVSGVNPCRCISAVIQAEKHFWKASGSIRQKTRRKVSCEGMPPGKVRKVLSQSILEWA